LATNQDIGKAAITLSRQRWKLFAGMCGLFVGGLCLLSQVTAATNGKTMNLGLSVGGIAIAFASVGFSCLAIRCPRWQDEVDVGGCKFKDGEIRLVADVDG
jgi:hypothetical protein